MRKHNLRRAFDGYPEFAGVTISIECNSGLSVGKEIIEDFISGKAFDRNPEIATRPAG